MVALQINRKGVLISAQISIQNALLVSFTNSTNVEHFIHLVLFVIPLSNLSLSLSPSPTGGSIADKGTCTAMPPELGSKFPLVVILWG